MMKLVLPDDQAFFHGFVVDKEDHLELEELQSLALNMVIFNIFSTP